MSAERDDYMPDDAATEVDGVIKDIIASEWQRNDPADNMEAWSPSYQIRLFAAALKTDLMDRVKLDPLLFATPRGVRTPASDLVRILNRSYARAKTRAPIDEIERRVKELVEITLGPDKDISMLPELLAAAVATAAPVDLDAFVTEYERRAAIQRIKQAAEIAIALADVAWIKTRGAPDEVQKARDVLAPVATPETAAEPTVSVWTKGDDVVDFLSKQEETVVWIKKDIVARGALTEIYSPRGIGKTQITYAIAKEAVDNGFTVLLLDRDNPRLEIKRRLRRWGLATVPRGRFRVMTRDEVPRLTEPALWKDFPREQYDLVIVDALDSTAEGQGEQDSSKPSKAFAVLLDIVRGENSPGMIVLGNTVRTGKHSRGSGVVEDRGDIVYEVRDATGLKPTGEKDWWLELPPAGADAWGERSSRRRGQSIFRLAFVQSKFRVGEEPDPFVLEMNLGGELWTYRDVTPEMLVAAGQSVEAQARDKQRRMDTAVQALQTAVRVAVEMGKPMKKGDAEAFLMTFHRLTEAEARTMVEVNNRGVWWIEKMKGKGSPLGLFPPRVDMVNEEEEERKETP
jgi:RecA/RadA recombinase